VHNVFKQFGPFGNFYEAPRWHLGAWWVSDFYAHQVQRLDVEGNATSVVTVEGQPGGLGWLPDGSLLIVSMLTRELKRFSDGELTTYADLSAFCPGWANDMCVTSSGNAYVGNFGFDLFDPEAVTSTTCLVMVAPDRSVHVVAEELAFPNACMVTVDERELIVNETSASRHSVFNIEADGSLTNRRVWASIGEPPEDPDHAFVGLGYAPDGGCLDADGNLWSSDALGSRVYHLAPGGEILDELEVPSGLHPFACCLGGETGETLLVVAAPDHDATMRSRAREGVLLVTELNGRV
jgi:sugar lactone lactonase YvrE